LRQSFRQIFLAGEIEVAYHFRVLAGTHTFNNSKRRKNSMSKRILMAGAALCAAFVLCAIAFAQAPRVTVGDKHGNMRAAQQLIQQAWQKVDEAQKDNHYNLGGHAGKAKELLAQASEEIKLSAEDANSHH
jgi:hypothetical protein